MEFLVGQGLRAQARLYNLAGVLADPVTLLAKLRSPTGAETTFEYGVGTEIVRDGTGLYHFDFRVDVPRDWTVRFVPTGNDVATPTEVTVKVSPSRFRTPI